MQQGMTLFSSLAPQDATLIAAILAALISLISLVVNVRAQKRLVIDNQYIAEKKAIRSAMQDLVELTGRVNTSIRRLVDLAPVKNDRELMIETTHTLAIVSVLFNRTSEDRLEVYPDQVSQALLELREELANFFLIIDYKNGNAGELRNQQKKLANLFAQLRKAISPYVAVKVDRLPRSA